MNRLAEIAKAIVAGATAFGGAFGTAYSDQVVTSAEWVGIAVTTVVAVVAVYRVPNAGSTEASDVDDRGGI